MNLQERIHINRIESEKKALIIELENTVKQLEDFKNKTYIC